MSEGFPENLLLVGTVVRPHGLGGLLRVRSYAESEKTFLGAGMVSLKCASGEIREHKVLSVVAHKNVLLMKLEGLNSLEAAEKYRGAAVLIRKDSLRRGAEDEYYWHELIGLRVYLNTGEFIGTIKHILPTGSSDIFVVQEGRGEVLIPAIHDVVKEIDLDNQRMIIFEMEGLFDLNEA